MSHPVTIQRAAFPEKQPRRQQILMSKVVRGHRQPRGRNLAGSEKGMHPISSRHNFFGRRPGFSSVKSWACSASGAHWRSGSKVGCRVGTTPGTRWFRGWFLPGSRPGSSGRNHPPEPGQTTIYIRIQRGHSPTPIYNTNRSRGTRNRPHPNRTLTGHDLLGF